MHLTIDGPAGPLEALLDEPDGEPGAPPRAAVVFGHPLPEQGGTMHTKVVFQGAKGLARIGCVVLRFNFRGVGASPGAFSGGEGEKADYQSALTFMHERYPDVPLWAAGFSFGAFVALETGAVDPHVSALIAIAPPVTRPNYSFEHTLASTKPKFIVQGDMDELCPLKDMWAFYARLKEPKELVVIDGGTHLFDGKTEEVGDALGELLGDFD
jgi:alpha/beta superfamily hydrolase